MARAEAAARSGAETMPAAGPRQRGATLRQRGAACFRQGGEAGSGRVARRGADLGLVAAGGLAAALLFDAATAVLAAGWMAATVAVVRSDLARFIIPDSASAAIGALGLVEAGLRAHADGEPVPDALWGAAGNGALAFAVFWLVAWAYRRRAGRDGLGFGDVKLAGACGLWLSLPEQVVALELACLSAVLALLLARGRPVRGTAIPFGAFLAPAAWLAFVVGPALGPLFGA